MRKYMAATLAFILAGVGIYMSGKLTWPVFGVIGLGVIALLGMSYFDGLKAGPVEIDENASCEDPDHE